jgi:acetyl-CoA carboxylase biotin carboxyl carrier protein
MGCGFAVGFPLTIFLFLTVLSNFPAVSGLVSSEMMTLALLMAAPAGFVIGNNLSYRRQTAPHRRQIEENARVIEECIRSLASLRQQTEAWKQEMRLFVAWQTRQPPTVVIDHEATGGNLEADCVVVRSPIVGTYYDAPAPGAAPFVRLGDRVLPGQVLCIIESMKIKNEIEAEVGGVITAKLVEDGRGVEYGVKLFAIRPR